MRGGERGRESARESESERERERERKRQRESARERESARQREKVREQERARENKLGACEQRTRSHDRLSLLNERGAGEGGVRRASERVGRS